jgi:hypothetical protein
MSQLTVNLNLISSSPYLVKVKDSSIVLEPESHFLFTGCPEPPTPIVGEQSPTAAAGAPNTGTPASVGANGKFLNFYFFNLKKNYYSYLLLSGLNFVVVVLEAVN